MNKALLGIFVILATLLFLTEARAKGAPKPPPRPAAPNKFTGKGAGKAAAAIYASKGGAKHAYKNKHVKHEKKCYYETGFGMLIIQVVAEVFALFFNIFVSFEKIACNVLHCSTLCDFFI